MKVISIIITILSSAICLAAANESSFTPDSILAPVRGIYLESSDGETTGTVYNCAEESQEGCMIDITDDSALAGLTVDAQTEVGEYTKVVIGTCKDEGTYDVRIKGQVTLGGTLYYTTSSADVLSTNAADLDYATVQFNGCQRDYTLPSTLTVSEGASIDLSLFMTLPNVAWANLSTATIPGGCKSSGTRSVCIAYPDIVPFLGATTPTLETYHIDESLGGAANAGGQVNLLFDNADNFIGGSMRRLFSQTSVALSSNFDTPIRFFEVNADSTLRFGDFGETATTSSAQFDEFERTAADVGTYTCPDGSCAGPINYESFLQ